MSLVCSVGLLSAELALSPEREAKLLGDLVRYTEILERWSRVQRLFGWRKASLLASEGIADAWAMLPLIDAVPDSLTFDLGSGSGLPGLVLAIGRRDREIHLLESRRK
ncbi:MAG: RsmG family class I SAM-dependent methyltransferase, partial [Myxococcota bacterium]|nr:RsmG family class I SAM-dependent methyltransferase [Myxococcota bacterium]